MSEPVTRKIHQSDGIRWCPQRDRGGPRDGLRWAFSLHDVERRNHAFVGDDFAEPVQGEYSGELVALTEEIR
jgi:hypothetical protein